MKRKYVITKAYTQSEWDGVEFALVEVNKSFNHIKTLIGKLKELHENLGVDMLEVFCDNADFFVDSGELPEGFTIPDDDDAKIIELTDEEFNNLTKPEQTIKHGSFRVSMYDVTYCGYGKHTGEEFWCDVPHYLFEELEVSE